MDSERGKRKTMRGIGEEERRRKLGVKGREGLGV